MWKALIWKEFRECAIATGLGALAMLALTASAVHKPFAYFDPFGEHSLPFLTTGGYNMYATFACIFATILGFQQTFWESKQQTWLFLLHRPMSRCDLIRAKLATGTIVYLTLSILPLVVYLLWAITPGTHASPFFWEFVEPWCRVVVAGVMFYGVAFFCGLRPARWFGSRLIPLIGAAFLITVYFLTPTGIWTVLEYIIAVAIIVLVYFQIMEQANERSYP